MGVSKPLPASGRGLPEGFIYTLKTFQTPSKRMFEKWYSVIFITLLPPLVPPCKGETIKIQFPPLYKGRVRVG
jgi:hypothetical protein